MWIYDPAVMKQSISANPDTPEFNSVPGNPFYRLPVGSATHYGDHGYVALKSLHKCKGKATPLQLPYCCTLSQVSKIKVVSRARLKTRLKHVGIHFCTRPHIL